jgi:hypothetical protein
MRTRLTAVLAGAFMALAVHAQDPAPAAASFSEAEVKAFVSAAVEIRRINAEFEARVKAAETEQEQRELVLAASIQQNAAVAGRGLTAERYQQIIERIDSDPAFAETISQQLQAQPK